MNKAELVAAVDAALGDDVAGAESAALVQGIIDTIARTVTAGEKVSITGFGVFERRPRAARTGRNPYTGESIRVAATSVPRFRPSTLFKDVVAGRVKVPLTGRVAGRGTLTSAAAPAPRPATKTKPGAQRVRPTAATKKTPAKAKTAATKTSATTKARAAATKRSTTTTKTAGSKSAGRTRAGSR